MAKPKLTNLTRSGAGRVDRPSVTDIRTRFTSRQNSPAVSFQSTLPPRLPIVQQELSIRLAVHIRSLSGVEITDAYKFDRVQPQRTEAEWMALIDEAWALRDTVLRSEKYLEFNAGKIINYAGHRETYRKRLKTSMRVPAHVDHEQAIIEAIEERNEELRALRFANLVMFGVRREQLSGRVSDEELDGLYPREAT